MNTLTMLNEVMNQLNIQPQLRAIRVNSSYLPTLLHHVKKSEVNNISDMFTGVPVIVDNRVETYECDYK